MRPVVVGRFHALTCAQAAWLRALAGRSETEEMVCVITSADHAGTRRNPLPLSERLNMMRPLLASLPCPTQLLKVPDVSDDRDWVQGIERAVLAAGLLPLQPSDSLACTGNPVVAALFEVAGYRVERQALEGPAPFELIQRIVSDQPWREWASAQMVSVYEAGAVADRLRAIYAEPLLTEDGELAHHRDFDTYGTQMDASLSQKLADMLPYIRPGCIVDKGCGTGMLLVALSHRYPESELVGVDLSREFLRRSDQNHYGSEQVTLVQGNVMDPNVAPGSATTVVLSSVMHEVYSYSDYALESVHHTLRSAASDLAIGGHLVIRDGLRPELETVRMQFLDAKTDARFRRFAKEFERGAGAPHRVLAPDRVELSSHYANEFLCKKNYVENWAIEVHEVYGVLTLSGWRRALEAAGFEVVTVHGILNPWIVSHRYEGSVRLTNEADEPLPWPRTNFVAVGRRRARVDG